MINRLKEYISAKYDGNNLKFSKVIGIPQPTLTGYLLGNQKLSLKVITATLASDPTLSAEWLMRGRGSMFTQIGDPNQTMLLNYLKKALEDERQRNEDLTRQLGEAREDLKTSPASSASSGDASTISRRRSA